MSIDINFFRGLSTVLVMIAFVGVCLWAYSSKRKEEFSKAAQMPFAEDDLPAKNSSDKDAVSSLDRSRHE